MFSFLRNNTLSRAELSESEGKTRDVHYGDILVKFGEVIDARHDELPRIASDALAGGLSCQPLANGDVIIADTAEDEAVGKCSELRGCGDYPIVSGLHTMACRPELEFASGYLGYYMNSPAFHDQLLPLMQGIKVISVSKGAISDTYVRFPSLPSSTTSSPFISDIGSIVLVSLLLFYSPYEGRPHVEGDGFRMLSDLTKDDTFKTYYREWITVYKEGAVRQVTLNKYLLALVWIERLAPDITLGNMDRIAYQHLLNQYAKTHERQTTMDFHHLLKGADEGLIPRDPTRKAIIKGKAPGPKKNRYLNQFELHKLLASLNLGQDIGWEWFILLVAKTGLRFSEAMAVTPADFDFGRQTLSVSKTWDYKNGGGFVPTKNRSSVRKVQIDWQLIVQFSALVKDLPDDKPLFVKEGKHVYNSTANEVLARLCKQAGVPVISIHGLRHTHASLLLFAGVSVASVAKRLGHASMNTTEKTYLHVIQELENKDVDLVMRSLTSLV